MFLGQIVAYVAALAIVVPAEVARISEAIAGPGGSLAWLTGINVDATLYALLLIAAPLFWRMRRPLIAFRRRRPAVPVDGLSSPGDVNAEENSGISPRGSIFVAWLLAGLVGVVSVAVSAGVAATPVVLDGQRTRPFGSLPPAYHDEYSYLFQAETFLAGRVSYPSHPTHPRLFDQMHVLNEGQFAGRYFPGTAAWISPFLAMGRPYWGHWLAGAISAMFVFGIGRELSGNGVGLLAGLLTAVSPGMALFSNMLLAHHPTLVGLTLFLFFFLRMQRTKSRWEALLAGAGLTFAMFCRPMTAAGVGLPFGLWLLWWPWRGDSSRADYRRSARFALVATVAAPVLVGFGILFVYNRAITGDGLQSPYQVYTDLHTPRHAYGFNNVVRAQSKLGPRVIEEYDRWAENLTPQLAVKNVRNRFLASWQWTLGIVPLVMGGIVFVFGGRRLDGRWWLIAAAIVSLHAAHVPYWYDGILHWHYVFESGPLWTLVFAAATGLLFTAWHSANRPWMPGWWTGIISAALLVTYVSAEPFWAPSRIAIGIDQFAFSRRQYALFDELVERAVTSRPALVLIGPDARDRHIDYVVNDPALESDVLFGRYEPDRMPLAEIVRSFPDRTVYLFREDEWQLVRVGGRVAEF